MYSAHVVIRVRQPRQRAQVILAALLGSAVVLAQQTPPPAGGRGASDIGGATIQGKVVDGDKPVAGLTVRAISRVVRATDPSANYVVRSTAKTNALGEYRFAGLAPDAYVIDVHFTQVTMPPSVLKALTGPSPVANAAVRARHIEDSMGPSLYGSGTDVGGFRFYSLNVATSAKALILDAGNDIRIYRPVVFQDVQAIRDARIVTVRIGDVAQVDLHVLQTRGFRVSGVLKGKPDEIGFLGVRLLPILDNADLFRDADFEHAVTVTDELGRFTFLGVPAGRYTLKALYVPSVLPIDAPNLASGTSGRVGARGGGAPTEAAMDFVRWSEAIVTIADGDVTGLDVPLNEALKIAGRIEVTGASAPVDFAQARVMLFSNRPVTIAPPLSVPVGADGSFTFRAYGPGVYSAQVSGIPGASAAGQFIVGSAAANRWLTVPPDGIAGITVRLAPAPARGTGPLGLPPPTTAPPPASSPDNGFVAGHAIDGDSGAAIAGATITLQPNGASITARRIVTTDAAGAFLFGEATPGVYAVMATAAGYSASGFGKVRADGRTATLGLATRERVTAMVIRMWKPGVVTGRVTDTSGRPLDGVSVVSVDLSNDGPAGVYLLRTFTRTDASGTYQFRSMTPGHYVFCALLTPTSIPETVEQTLRADQTTPGSNASPLAALLAQSRAPLPSPNSTRIGNLRFAMAGPELLPQPMPLPITEAGEIRSYRSTCYPDANAVSAATVVTIAAGQQKDSVDLHLPATSGVRVSGSLRFAGAPLAHTGVRLLRAADSQRTILGSERLDAAATISNQAGEFTFLGVVPGQYVLRAWTTAVPGEPAPIPPPVGRPPARANGVTQFVDMPITVTNSAFDVGPVTLAPTPRITGRIVFEGSAEGRPSPEQFLLALTTPNQFDPPLPLARRPGTDGTFVLSGYFPGTYQLPAATVGDWRIATATLNGQPIESFGLTVANADVAGLTLVATDRPTRVRGTVTPVFTDAPIAVAVCIFPADYRRWIAEGMMPFRTRLFRPTGTWTYDAAGFPPGDYFAIAYLDADGDDFSTAFYDRLAKLASKVTLTPGQTESLDLRVATIK